jgi:uncharacterized protein
VNAAINLGGVLAMLLAAGGLIGLMRPSAFSWRWLLIAAALVAMNDVLVTNVYGWLPHFKSPGHWNWQGKILALAAVLSVAALPAFGRRRTGLTFVQAPGSWRPAAAVAVAYAAVFVVLALAFPDEPAKAEDIAFQMTLPGLQEEPFYRGVLLLALDRAFMARRRLFGVDWGWGAVISCALFGLDHAFGFSRGGFTFDPLYMALTALPSFLAVWVALRTRSLLLPVLMHNFGNTISLLI